MPAPAHIRDAVLILCPEAENVKTEISIAYARMAGRAALNQALIPICPKLFYWPYCSADEINKKLIEFSTYWLKRSGRIWLCDPVNNFGYDEVKLDFATHHVLIHNEGSLGYKEKRYYQRSRLKVYSFQQKKNEDEFLVNLLSREEVAEILRCNIIIGHFRGVDL